MRHTLEWYLSRGFTMAEAQELIKLEKEQLQDDNNRVVNNSRAGILDYDTMENLEEFDSLG